MRAKFNRGDKAKIVSPSLGPVGTVVMVKRPHLEGYNIRFPDGRTDFALPEELEPTE